MNDISTLKTGYAVALTLAPDTAPRRCYVGQIEAIDLHGIRITLIDWLLGSFCGNDLFVPWSNIQSAYISTEKHDLTMFLGTDAPRWQENMDERRNEQYA